MVSVLLACGNKSVVPGETDAGDADTDTDTDADADADTDGPTTFVAHVVDNTRAAPQHVTVGDLTGDAVPDLVVSYMGEFPAPNVPPTGTVVVYSRNGAMDDWTASVVVDASAGILFPNQATLHDVDGDFDPDLILPSGSAYCNLPNQPNCGAINWFENTQGGPWTRHQVVSTDVVYYTSIVVEDIDGDGIKDLVTVGESTANGGFAEARWFRGNGSGYDPSPNIIGLGMGAFPVVYDIDGDGDNDVLSAEYNVDPGSFAWYERTGANSWSRHVIDNSLGPSWMFIVVPDLMGDGVAWGVGTNRSNTTKQTPDPWESAAFAFEVPADPRNGWTATPISTGIEVNLGALDRAPGMLGAGDLDGDGDIDLAVAGDGDNRVFLLEQRADGSFETRVLWNGIAAAAGMKISDLDLSGTSEIIVVSPTDDSVLIIERI